MTIADDDITFDGATPDAAEQAATAVAGGQSTGQVGELVALWKRQNRWVRWPLAAVGVWTALTGLTAVRNVVAGDDGPPTAAAAPAAQVTTSTIAGGDDRSSGSGQVDPLAGLPELHPFAAALVPSGQRAELANKVRTLTIDGTSICDLWFGIEFDDGNRDAVWALTTQAMQAAAQTGAVLPTDAFPVRLFGGDCEPVAATTTTVAGA